MTLRKPAPALPYNLASAPTDFTTDYRARTAAEESDKMERRRQTLVEQTSELNPPDKRIRIWEQLHVLSLPLEERHPLLNLIARETELTLDQVQAEQRQRSAALRSGTEKARKINDPYCVLSGGGAKTK